MSSSLSEQEIEKIRKKFNQIDRDGDGVFSLDDYLLYLTQKKQKHTTVEAALYTTKVGLSKVKKKTKELVGEVTELKFEKTVYIRVPILGKDTTEGPAKGWKQFLYKPYYEDNSIKLLCFDDQIGARIEEYDMDFTKIISVEMEMLQEEFNKNQYWFSWKIPSLPYEFACTSQRDLEEWTQNMRYLHNRVALSRVRRRTARYSSVALKQPKSEQTIDPVLLEELKGLDPFGPGKTKEEKEAIWNRINEIRDMIGEDALGHDTDDDGVKTESISTESSEEDSSEEGGEKKPAPEMVEATPQTVTALKLDSLKKVASSTSKKMAEKTKVVAEKTKEKADILTARTASSGRALKSSVGHVKKNVVGKVKGDT